MSRKNAKLWPVLSILIFPLLLFGIGNLQIKAEDLPAELVRLNQEIEEYQQEISRLQSQANTLANQIAQFNAQIRLAELKIFQTESKILLLGGRIDQLTISLDALSNAFSSRAVETYKMSRIEDPMFLLVSVRDLAELFSRYHYLQRIQEADRDLLARLQEAQSTYKEEKTDQEELQEELEDQKKVLGVQKTAKANLLTVTKNDEKRYQSLLAQAIAQKEAFLRFITGQGGASILHNQTVCDDWGCYYNQRDSLWGNQSMGLSGLPMAEYGCLVSSVAMIASHYGINIKPLDIASNPSAFFGNTAYLSDSFVVNGINVRKNHVSASLLDGELDAGRPVIAGLYSGPGHFIVIKEKSGDNYIMHDPFMENGNNRPLSDKYSLSDIKTLRLISFY